MAPKCLPPELLLETANFIHAKKAVPKVFSSCWLLQTFLLPRVVKWKKEERIRMNDKILNSRYGLMHPDTGQQLTLMEAQQMGLYDPDSRQLRNNRTGELMSLFDCHVFCPPSVQRRLIQLGALKVTPIKLEQALSAGYLHPSSGIFSFVYVPHPISFRDAICNNIILLPTRQLPHGLTLTDCLDGDYFNQELVAFGTHSDHFTLHYALNTHPSLVKNNVPECVNTATGQRLTIAEAILAGMLNAHTGRFKDMATGEEMTLEEAHENNLIKKPRTLTELIDEDDLLDAEGYFIDFEKPLTLLEAISAGLIDVEVRHIKSGQNNEVISVGEALKRGRLTPTGEIVLGSEDGAQPGQKIGLQAAMERGLLTDSVRHTIFNIKAFGATRKEMSFNEAFREDIAKLRDGVWGVTPLDDQIKNALGRDMVDAEIANHLTAKYGLWDHQVTQEVSFACAAERGLVDPFHGVVLRPDIESVSTTYQSMLRSSLLDVHPSVIQQ